jgi:type IV pilus assembly protein PilA
MKRDFQAKFLMHMASKKQENEGFTLIELLVVIIIIGILAAIALPSLLGQVNKAKQSEARNNIGSMNRAQQAYALDTSKFTTDVSELGIGIQTQTANYYYDIEEAKTTSGDLLGLAANRATPLDGTKTLKNYGGAVALIQQTSTAGGAEALTIATVFERKEPIAKGDAKANNPGSFVFKVTDAKYNTTQKKLEPADAKKYKDLGK